MVSHCADELCSDACRCIQDVETGKEFFLSMVLYTNANGVLNDDKYEYDLAYAVAADVAEAVAKALWCQKPGPLSTDAQTSLFAPGWDQWGPGTNPVSEVKATPHHSGGEALNEATRYGKQPDIRSCYGYFLNP